jgi:hypothetical protein
MKVKTILKLVSLLVAVTIMAACLGVQRDVPVPITPSPEIAPLATPVVPTPVPADEAAAYVPASAEVCEMVRDDIEAALDAEAQLDSAPFHDVIDDRMGTGCQITVTGTGEDFGHFVEASQNLEEILTEAGWVQDMGYMADGPTGTAFGMRMNGMLALVNVEWEPADEAGCPDDVPIVQCDVAPEHQLFTIAVNIAESTEGMFVQAIPVDEAECEAIRAQLAGAFNVEVERFENVFRSEIAGLYGTACIVGATGTGADFEDFLDVADTMRQVLSDAGWTENIAYLADGPTGTAFGYEMNGQLALGRVEWHPADEADCPPDEPITECPLQPEEQIFTILLELVQSE